MHLAGFEPAMSLWEADYESDAFGHLATDALELVGFEPTSTKVFKLLFYLKNIILIKFKLIFKKTLHIFFENMCLLDNE